MSSSFQRRVLGATVVGARATDRGHAGTKIAQELVDDRCVPRADRRVQAVGWLLTIEVPAPFVQRVAEGEDIELRARQREDVGVGGADYFETGERAHAVDELSGRVDRDAREPPVPVYAQPVHDRPRGRHWQTGPASLHPGRRVQTAEPIVEHERLVAAKLLRA